MKIIKQAAEAILYLKDNKLVKDRIKKNYRLDEIDEKLRKFRTKREAKLLNKASVINVPKVFDVDGGNSKIVMEYIKGKLLKDYLDKFDKKNRVEICKKIGNEIALLHDNDIVHGDLTTSNMILKDDKIYFIDFGLGFVSDKIEDKAVDLHLLKQALESKHYKYFKKCFDSVLEGYKKSKNFKSVIERLRKVETRGRYKRR